LVTQTHYNPKTCLGICDNEIKEVKRALDENF
jgi:ankyrin repeat protein